MICRVCKKEISDNSAFCNYCGKRVKKQVDGMRLYDHIRFLPDADAKKAIQLIATLPADQIKQALYEKQKAVYVYVPQITYKLTRDADYSGYNRTRHEKTNVINIAADLKCIFGWKSVNKSTVSVYINCMKLNANDYSPDEEGISFFRTMYECEEAVKKELEINRIQVNVYAEEDKNA